MSVPAVEVPIPVFHVQKAIHREKVVVEISTVATVEANPRLGIRMCKVVLSDGLGAWGVSVFHIDGSKEFL